MDNKDNVQIEKLFLEIWDQNYTRISNFIAFKLHSAPEMQEDCLQEVFLALLKKLIKEEEIQYPEAWLMKTAHNIVIKFYKEINLQNILLYGDISIFLEDCAMFLQFNEEPALSDNQILEIIQSQLNNSEKQLFNMLVEGTKPETIAKRLHIKTNTLYQRIFKLKKKAKNIINLIQ